MRLADFILANREPILAEWEAFARSCTPAAAGMDVAALRNDANRMLTVIAADLRTSQTVHEQSEKSKGHSPDVAGTAPATAHGGDRAAAGFSTMQMVAEYRALRASVIRLWAEEQGQASAEDLEDMIRFNEAIDQALAESVVRYTQELDTSKEMFLAILGHDLRTPLGAVMTSAEFMSQTGDLGEPYSDLASRIVRSAKRMNQMIGALLDFTRSRLGGGIPIRPTDMDMADAVRDVVAELHAAYPDRSIQMEADTSLRGQWDQDRVMQVFTNLVSNALQHGAPGAPVTVSLRGEGESVAVSVHNTGKQIPADQRATLFSPMKKPRSSAREARDGTTGSLGLGLYIADQIVRAHKGRIEVESSDEGSTAFTVHLPRHAV
ncbi:MAG TPA: sensor histidine kinase [Gemmatimonadaceae bacterium]|nr:sensor histidine kinase [Gemmatimonadaceae bacterium]